MTGSVVTCSHADAQARLVETWRPGVVGGASATWAYQVPVVSWAVRGARRVVVMVVMVTSDS
ncbi:hypothetical protein ACIF70_40460 [Actinacidiphila glaucinigra]|uniref:hypothetical protein n=1 Tax=Actinacidiphila glaucinigra TaxID=235986 RepID=UPI0037C820CB